MKSALYFNTREINDLQTTIMRFVDQWISKQKTFVPLTEIMGEMIKQGKKDFTVENALYGLIRKGFIRRVKMYATSGTGNGNRTFYKKLRGIS